MVFKALLLSVICFAFTVQPAQCGIFTKLANIKTAAVGSMSDLASIIPNVFKGKGSAFVQGAAQTGNIVAVGAGLKVKALERATSTMTDAVSNGLVAIGRLLSRTGTGVAEDKLNASPYANLGLVSQDGVPIKNRKLGKSVRRQILRSPYYDVVYTPRVYRGPHGIVRIE